MSREQPYDVIEEKYLHTGSIGINHWSKGFIAPNQGVKYFY
jgi:hypothetical protein